MTEEIRETPRRINISVEVLDERLRNWNDEIRRGQEAVMSQLRHMADRYDNQIGALELWRSQYELKFDFLSQSVELLKAEKANLFTQVEDLRTNLSARDITFKAKVSLLKSGWTWLIGAAFGASAFLGLASQLGWVNFG